MRRLAAWILCWLCVGCQHGVPPPRDTGVRVQSVLPAPAAATDSAVLGNGLPWYDVQGHPMVTGGALFQDANTHLYYRVGTHTLGGGDSAGLDVYRSRTLQDWTWVQTLLTPQLSGWGTQGCPSAATLSQPQILYNAVTHDYVLVARAVDAQGHGQLVWAHAVSPDAPFALVGCAVPTVFDSSGAVGPAVQQLGDMTAFVDSDGAAYVMYAADGNEQMDALAGDYLSIASAGVAVLPTALSSPLWVHNAVGYFVLSSDQPAPVAAPSWVRAGVSLQQALSAAPVTLTPQSVDHFGAHLSYVFWPQSDSTPVVCAERQDGGQVCLPLVNGVLTWSDGLWLQGGVVQPAAPPMDARFATDLITVVGAASVQDNAWIAQGDALAVHGDATLPQPGNAQVLFDVTLPAAGRVGLAVHVQDPNTFDTLWLDVGQSALIWQHAGSSTWLANVAWPVQQGFAVRVTLHDAFLRVEAFDQVVFDGAVSTLEGGGELGFWVQTLDPARLANLRRVDLGAPYAVGALASLPQASLSGPDTWTLQGNLVGPANASQVWVAPLPMLQDATVQAVVTTPAFAGVMLRGTPATTWAGLGVDVTHGQLTWFNGTDGGPLASVVASPNTPFLLQVALSGPNAWVEVNGRTVFRGAVAGLPLQVGSAGLEVGAGGGTFGQVAWSTGVPSAPLDGSALWVDDTDPSVQRGGVDWTVQGALSVGCVAQDSIAFAFVGTAFALVAHVGPDGGQGEWLLDGVPPASGPFVDTYAGAPADGVVVAQSSGLAWGLHTVTLINQGYKDSGSTAACLRVDGVRITR